MAGVVDAVGGGVTTFKIGDEVLGRAVEGAYADFALCRVEDLARKPRALRYVAGSLAITAETAVRTLDLLDLTSAVAPGGMILVHAASGGVGLLAVQLARIRSARVIGTAGPGRLDLVQSLGVDVTPYGRAWPVRVRALAPAGVDAVLDVAGQGVLEQSVAMTGDPHAVLTIADPGADRFGVRYSRGLLARLPMAEVFSEVVPRILEGRIDPGAGRRTVPPGARCRRAPSQRRGAPRRPDRAARRRLGGRRSSI